MNRKESSNVLSSILLGLKRKILGIELVRRVLSRVLGRPIRFSWVIEGKIAWSSRIYSRRELKWLVKQGIRAILTVDDKPLSKNLMDYMKKHGVSSKYIMLPDHAFPTTEQIRQALLFITHNIADQMPVLVHCNAGIGRSGVIIAIYLINSGLSPEDAIMVLRSLRPEAIEPEQERTLISIYSGEDKKQ